MAEVPEDVGEVSGASKGGEGGAEVGKISGP